MKNFIQKGEYLDFVAPVGGVTSGTAVLIGGILVVPVVSADAGAVFSGCAEGVFELPKEATADFAAGDPVYWDDTAKEFDEADSGRFQCATCVEAAAASTTVVKVKLKGDAVIAEA
jgi:predicted RecA/RadA family phage recombinase